MQPPQTSFSPEETTALVFITGFAIQQALQILDPFVNWFLQSRSTRIAQLGDTPTTSLPDRKRTTMAFLALGFGAIATSITGIRLLALLNKDYCGVGDFLVTALVLSSGTDAANSVVKYLGYVKDARKPQEVDLEVVPHQITMRPGEVQTFQALRQGNVRQDVTWRVVNIAGGQIDSSTGKYKAGEMTGTVQVVASLTSDPTVSAVATITVT